MGTFRRNDQVTFLHPAQVRLGTSRLPRSHGLGEFRAGITGRVDQPPVQDELTEAGSYRFFAR